MKVKKLKEILEKYDEDQEIVIEIINGNKLSHHEILIDEKQNLRIALHKGKNIDGPFAFADFSVIKKFFGGK
jgi:hypothetical protein